MSKEQEALDRIKYMEQFESELDIYVRVLDDEDSDIAILQEFITNYKLELEKLNATIQNKNAVINSLSKKGLRELEVYGYKALELAIVARLLRENGINPKTLSNSVESLMRGFELAQEEMIKKQEEMFDRMIRIKLPESEPPYK